MTVEKAQVELTLMELVVIDSLLKVVDMNPIALASLTDPATAKATLALYEGLTLKIKDGLAEAIASR